MADLWEICEVATPYSGNDIVYIYTPEEATHLTIKKFIIRYYPSIEYSGDHRSQVIRLLLSDGWEPYGSTERGYLLRRKYQS